MIDNYLIEYSSIELFSIEELLHILNATEGKRISELKVRDLTFHNNKEIWRGEGVYLFRRNKDIVYVGKVSSMSFTERIGKHFDLRKEAWMNRLLKLISEKELILNEETLENLKSASLHAFENLNIVLINFKTREVSRINRLETLLRACTKPLNGFKNLKINDYNQIINQF
jgi:hypothetical protein